MTFGRVIALARGKKHGITKERADSLLLLEGLGVDGDAHCGARVKHRSRARYNPGLPNLRQVHFIQADLYDELSEQGFSLSPGTLGENATLEGIKLLAQMTGSIISFPSGAEVTLTGLRNPCIQLDGVAPGLMNALIAKNHSGQIVRKGGVMGIVTRGGLISMDDIVTIVPADGPPLKPV